MEHAYDFYKPTPGSEYPVVDGKLSIQSYFKALDHCYEGYAQKFKAATGKEFSLSQADFYVFHSPYNKLVHQSFARMMFNDFVSHPEDPQFSSVKKFKNTNKKAALQNRALTTSFLQLSSPEFKTKVEPSTLLNSELGNLNCGALYACLLSLIDQVQLKVGQRIVLFAYGSGLTSSMFSLKVHKPVANFNSNLKDRLRRRIQVPPQKYTQMLLQNEIRHHEGKYTPISPTDQMFAGTYYLTSIDSQNRRFYDRSPPDSKL